MRPASDRRKADATQEFASWLKALAKSPAYALEVHDPNSYLGDHFDRLERVMMSCASDGDDFSVRLRQKIRAAIGDHSKPEDTIVDVHRTLVAMLSDKPPK